MKRKQTLLVTILAMLALVFTMATVSFAEEIDYGTQEHPCILHNLTLEPEGHGISKTLQEATREYSAFFEYTTQTDITMCLEIDRNSDGDKHKDDNSDYVIEVTGFEPVELKANDAVATMSADFALTKPAEGEDGKYSIKVTRKYNVETGVTDPYIGIKAKAKPTEIEGDLTTGFTASEAGTDYLTRFYKFTPSQSGGYEFTIDGLNEATLENQFVELAITGTKLNESVTLEEGQKSCKLRVYLTAGTEYILSVRDKRVNIPGPLENMKYTFTAKKVTAGTGVSVSGATPLSLSPTNECKIYPFLNKRAFAYYSFTAAEEGYYEFNVVESEIQNDEGNDITVELRDSDFSPVEEEDQLQLYSGEGGTLIRKLGANETCYIQVCEMYKGALADVYTRNIAVSKHVHATKPVIDGDHVTMCCPCMDEEEFVCDFWLDGVGFNNAAYTGSAVVPTPTFDMFGWYSKDDTKPVIPETAYTVNVTSKNKTDIGKAKAKLTFVGEYEDLGSFTATFKIVPAGTTVKSVSGGTKAITVKWAKQSKKTSGYQVQYSLNSNMKSAKSVTIAKNKTTSKKIAKLNAKKTYYVRVRTYKTVGKTKYYSAWSDVMSATTK